MIIRADSASTSLPPGTAKVTYAFYSNNTCANTATTSQDVTVAADGTVPDSAAKTLGPGSYSYKATYSGTDDGNAGMFERVGR